MLIVANPASGRGHGAEVAERARRELERRGLSARVHLSRDADDVLARVRAEVAAGAAAVAVAGGDGTVHRAIQAVASSATALGLLPCGRGNDLARALGVPFDPEGAARVLVEGAPRAIDLGRVGGSVFSTVSMFGFDAEAADLVYRRQVPGRGTVAYVLAALTALKRYRAPEAALAGDFGRIEGRFFLVAVANTRSYGGGMRIAPDARPDDGLLDVVAVSDVSRFEVLRLLPRVFSGGHVRHPAVRVLRTRELRAEAARPLAVFADGEPAGHLPATFTALPGALRVLAPR